MRRLATWCLLAGLLVALPVIARAATTVMVGNAPSPPVVGWRAEPRMVIVPGTMVYVVHNYEELDYDYFRYGAWYYVYHRDHWYKAPEFRGPFAVVHEADVPKVFYGLHDRGYHWKHRPHGVPMARTTTVKKKTPTTTKTTTNKVVAVEKHVKPAANKTHTASNKTHKPQHVEKHGEKRAVEKHVSGSKRD